MVSKGLQKLKDNPSFLGIYVQGMGMLSQSGIFDYLREMGRCHIVENGKDPHVMATQAARSAGFNQCLDILLNMRDLLADEDQKPKALYGANRLAAERGDLTEDEINAIESGTTPVYRQPGNSTDTAKPAAPNNPGSITK